MKRRSFLTSFALLPMLAVPAIPVRAENNDLTFGIFPGTGTADLPLDELRTAIMPFAQAMAAALGAEQRHA